jgi:1-acyl-sn-glycerol-3-phosphate acyltransferase
MDDWLHDLPAPPALSWAGYMRAITRATAIISLLTLGVLVFYGVRMIEAPIFGRRRPWTIFIVQAASRGTLKLIGLKRICEGQPLQKPGAIVANHASWLDIMALSAGVRGQFISKAEVSGWPGIGILARITDTLFIRRKSSDAKFQQAQITERLEYGQRLVFFPEGTSTDCLRVLPFKSSLFAAFFDNSLRAQLYIQPVSLRYTAPKGQDPRHYGLWGGMRFGHNLMRILAAPGTGCVSITYHPALRVTDFESRKTLALACERAVHASFLSAKAGVTCKF